MLDKVQKMLNKDKAYPRRSLLIPKSICHAFANVF